MSAYNTGFSPSSMLFYLCYLQRHNNFCNNKQIRSLRTNMTNSHRLDIMEMTISLVLLDHVVYTTLNEVFRKDFCQLWEALVVKDSMKTMWLGERYDAGKYSIYLPFSFTRTTIESLLNRHNVDFATVCATVFLTVAKLARDGQLCDGKKDEMEQGLGRKVSRGEVWISTYKHANGDFVNDEARKISDSLAHALGSQEHYRRVRGMGLGPCPSRMFGYTRHLYSGMSSPSPSYRELQNQRRDLKRISEEFKKGFGLIMIINSCKGRSEKPHSRE
ncbi:hypothetical protein Fmac_017873 [Flemingia macrophylla]|uniref:Uncharacterized protein n=1 Tax=Flemingia macrophylla TaxID=520843 RepID=A0ABD1M3B1_9FABA